MYGALTTPGQLCYNPIKMDGTSLDDLNYDSAGTSDRDIVKDILHIVNNGGANGRPPLPQMTTRNPQPMQNLPPPSGNTEMNQQNYTMDPSVGPQAHMIGNAQPTPADFANLMQMNPRSMQTQPMMQHQPQQQHQMQPPMYPMQFAGSNNTWSSALLKESKIPIFVAILVFIVNLPVFNLIISHSLPSLISVTGGLTTGGMVVKALVAGFLFWIVQRVLAPLVSE